MSSPHSSPVLTHPLAFIGGGNMARSLIGGLIKRGADPSRIRVAEPAEPLRAALAADFGVQVFAEAGEAVYGADTWLFAVKPQVMRTVCESLASMAQAQRPLVVSIAAGITVAQMQRWLGGGVPVVRSMPNTPALLGAGVTGLHASDEVDAAGRERAELLLSAAGPTVWIDAEAKMDAVTGVSGSGPAYVFLLAEAMESAAVADQLAQMGVEGLQGYAIERPIPLERMTQLAIRPVGAGRASESWRGMP